MAPKCKQKLIEIEIAAKAHKKASRVKLSMARLWR